MSIKIKLLQDQKLGKKGDIVEVPDKEGDILTRGELAEKAPEESLKEQSEPNSDSNVEPLMGDKPETLESWAKGGNYLSAENCEEGDIITIVGFSGMGSYQDSDNEYPIFEAKHDKKDALLRVNKQNANNIADAFGWKPENWVGEQVKVTQIVNYPNLGNKGLLLSPITD